MGWEVGGSFKREGTYVYLWLIHVDVWQKPTQFCEAIILQLKSKLIKKTKTKTQEDSLCRGKSNQEQVWSDPSIFPSMSYSVPFGGRMIQKLEKKETTFITLALLPCHTDAKKPVVG